MGLGDFVKRKVVEHQVKKFEREHMKQWEEFKRWLNASPGRKRGIAAVLLSLAFGAEYLGYLPAAEGFRFLNHLLEGIQVGTGLSGVAMTVWGWAHARQREKGKKWA